MTVCPICGGTMVNKGPAQSSTASATPSPAEWWVCQSCPYAVAVTRPEPISINVSFTTAPVTS